MDQTEIHLELVTSFEFDISTCDRIVSRHARRRFTKFFSTNGVSDVKLGAYYSFVFEIMTIYPVIRHYTIEVTVRSIIRVSELTFVVCDLRRLILDS